MRRPRFDNCIAAEAMEAALPHLRANCWLAKRKNRDGTYSFNFRYRERATDGTRRQRSINVDNDPVLVTGAQEAIALSRLYRARKRAQAAQASARRKHVRALEIQMMAHVSGSRRYRQSVRRAFRERCATDPLPTVQEFLDGLDGLKLRRRRAGRPYKHRLW